MPSETSQVILRAALAAAPWCLAAPFLAFRIRGTPSLAGVSGPGLHGPAVERTPRVSVIVPARNEAAHIGDCVRSIRASTWPDLEVVVVNDGSTDGTRELARDAGSGDVRLTVVDAPPLPAGWFGKQWACQAGARIATGELLLFTDADTRHAPDLVQGMVRMRALRGAELLSVAGRQDMETFAERAVQPLIFALILARYGGAANLEQATRASDVLANGQCFMVSRAKYDELGGHERVRDFVAEDVMMAQAVWSTGGRVSIALGREQLRTRMYDGLASLVRGWTKNVYAGGRHAMRGGRFGRAIFPLLLLAPPVLIIVPSMTLLLMGAIALLMTMMGMAMSSLATALLVWSAIATAGLLTAAALLNVANGDPARRAFYALPGAFLLLYICVVAIARGSGVRWKDRSYVAR